MKPGLGKATPAWKPVNYQQDINEIQRIVNLIQKVDCKSYALITDTAKELGIKKTVMMQYIEDNPKLFKLVEVKNSKGVVTGLGISVVYTDPVNNPVTEEWLVKKKEEWKNKIQVFGEYYYGVLEFHFIAVDSEKTNGNRENLWRNTPEKIQTLIDAGLIKKVKSGYGGLGDYYNWEGYKLDIESTNALKEAGWELVYPKE